MDSDGKTVRAKSFGDTARKYYDSIQKDQVYRLSRFRTAIANQRFNKGVTSQYEITLEESSAVEPVNDVSTVNAIGHIPTESLLNIDALRNLNLPPAQQTDASGRQRTEQVPVDTMGIVLSVKEAVDFTSRSGNTMRRRDLTIVDDSLLTIDVTLFAAAADQYTTQQLDAHPVLFFRGARLSDFNGRSLSVGFGGEVALNPQLPQAQRLRQWYETKGHEATFTALSGAGVRASSSRPVTFLGDLRDDLLMMKLRQSESGTEYASVRGYVSLPRIDNDKKPWYEACNNPALQSSERPCRKKVNGTPGSYHCDSCNVSFPECKYLYIANVSVSDGTGQKYVSVFNEDAEVLFGCPASEIAGLLAADMKDRVDAMLTEQNYKLCEMRLRFKAEMAAQGEDRVRATAMNLTVVDPASDAKAILAKMEPLDYQIMSW